MLLFDGPFLIQTPFSLSNDVLPFNKLLWRFVALLHAVIDG